MTVYGTLIDNATNDPTAVLPAFAYPYDVDCQWPPPADGEKRSGVRTVSVRPVEIPVR
jgi:hypothetical protein